MTRITFPSISIRSKRCLCSAPLLTFASRCTDNPKGAQSYLIDGANKYGLPSDDGIGVTVSGQPIFPIYNNNAEFTPEKCEVDSCNEHVGQGGGPPHLHGDPFGDQTSTTCLYGPSNYTGGSKDAHPPLIGFSYDGQVV